MVTTATGVYGKEQGLAPWWLGLLHGATALAAGALLVAGGRDPGLALVQPLGWYWLAAGVLGCVRMFMDHTLWGVRLAAAILGLVAGTWILQPRAAAALAAPPAYVWALGLLAIALGAAETVEATSGREPPLYALGLLDVLIGIVLVFDPLAGVAPAELLGISMLAVGCVAVSMALRARWPTRIATPPSARDADATVVRLSDRHQGASGGMRGHS